MRIVIKRTQRDVQAVTLRGEVIELRDKLNPWADRFKQPGRQQYEPDTGKGSGDHGGVGEHGMAESDTVPNWGDLGPSRKARTLHPISGAEGQRMGVEESELVIVLRAWESHVQGEARAQNTGRHRTISLTQRRN